MRIFPSEVAGNGLEQGRLLDRFGEVLGTTGFQAPAGFLFRRVSRQRQDRHRMCLIFRFPSANGASGLQPIHHWHLQVHEHKMGAAGDHFLDCHLAILSEIKLEAAVLEIGLQQHDIVLRVFRNQDA